MFCAIVYNRKFTQNVLKLLLHFYYFFGKLVKIVRKSLYLYLASVTTGWYKSMP